VVIGDFRGHQLLTDVTAIAGLHEMVDGLAGDVSF